MPKAKELTGVGTLVLAHNLHQARYYVQKNPHLRGALIASPRSAPRLRGFLFKRIEVVGPLVIEGDLLELVAQSSKGWL